MCGDSLVASVIFTVSDKNMVQIPAAALTATAMYLLFKPNYNFTMYTRREHFSLEPLIMFSSRETNQLQFLLPPASITKTLRRVSYKKSGRFQWQGNRKLKKLLVV